MYLVGALFAGVVTTAVSTAVTERSDGGVIRTLMVPASDDWVSRLVNNEVIEDVEAPTDDEFGPSDGGIQYSADVSDEELARRYQEDLASLGSLSIGRAENGRVINGVQMPPGDAWTVVDPEHSYGTQETIDFLKKAAHIVSSIHPGARLRVGHISGQRGGLLLPHRSHQSGRDVDIGLFHRTTVDWGAPKASRELLFDPVVSWTLIKALVKETDVQFVLLDHQLQQVLRDYALSIGESPAWIDRIFLKPGSLVRHAPNHHDHFHVRFFAQRSQELGRRLALGIQGERVIVHRVEPGDTVGRLASRYSSSARLIRSANKLTTIGPLRVGRSVRIPVRTPCMTCPIPPPVVVPPRRLPPELEPSS